MMAYASWSVVFGEQPSAAKWNILGTNDASFNDGTGLNNGSVQQVVSTTFSAVATGTTIIPVDDTLPQSTEGDQYMTQAITPKATTNLLVVEAVAFISSSAINDLIMALFQDATANALAVSEVFLSTAGGRDSVAMLFTMTAATTAATTFKIRIGGGGAGTTTFNGSGGGRQFSTAIKSVIKVTEHKA